MITKDRVEHSVWVAKRCREIARERGLEGSMQEEMFLLGWLHDTGYEFTTAEYHHRTGGEMARRTGFRYWREIRVHGFPKGHPQRQILGRDYCSEALDILNEADLTTLPDGRRCTARERLDELKTRGYAEDSEKYRNAETLAAELGLN